MVVAAILSAIFALTSLALVFAAVRVARMDYRSSIQRDRFFARFFRVFWVVACLVGAGCLLKAAWLVWVHPLAAAFYVLAVPVLVIFLIVVARGILPWLYRRIFRR
jgi:hypothetical protein